MKKEIKGTTRVCGLIGNPVHHTLSPAIHNTLNDVTGTDMVYVPFEVRENDVESAVKGAAALDILGLNVTVPHKSAVMPFLEDIDPVAERIGAVNTLVRTKDGTGFKGYNTDYLGILRSLKDAKVSLKGESVIILGAGGAGRPAAFLAAKEDAKEVLILNRTFEKAEKLCKEVNSFAGFDIATPMELKEYKKLPSDRKYICFQMTKVGLFPETEKAVIEDPDFYKKLKIGFDAVYRPLNTKFLKLCAEAGAKCISGLKMLLYQGVEAYEMWNDIKADDSACAMLYGKLFRELLEDRNIILTGFMGSGKSSVAKALCELLGYELVDTDLEIEREQKKEVKDIFAESGEQAFRDMETEYLERLSESDRTGIVLSVGGGLPIREKNRELLRKTGTVVFLKARPETVYERVKDDDSRPLLKADNVLEKIKSLQDERRDIYKAACDLEIDTDGKSVDRISTEIIEAML
ncbi:shikimate dehydrogenase [Butyrivibrio sp. AE3004]|uniref:shikimate dehydrogenase n=1 Tax=Butyrivibrio sp. AE3004 TaxID=1506994 RepID=UPI0009DF80C3|nr:shikimate dehydrogenase [Butyrivibrio sp. AE3004]